MLTENEKAEYFKRLQPGGAFYAADHLFKGSPADGMRILEQARIFKANPVVKGRGPAQTLTVWTGYANMAAPNQVDGERPFYIGINAMSSAFVCAVFKSRGGTFSTLADQCGRAFHDMMMAQVAEPNSRLALIPMATPGAYLGTKEGEWLHRLCKGYMYVKDLGYFTLIEQVMVMNWFLEQGRWLMNRGLKESLKAMFPDLATNNFGRKEYFANPLGVLALAAQGKDAIYLRKDLGEGEKFNDWSLVPAWRDAREKHVYCGMGANGTLVNKISRAAMAFNNRSGDICLPAGFIGVAFNDAGLSTFGLGWCTGYLISAVWPDGSWSEMQRLNDYGGKLNQHLNYGGLIFMKYLDMADLAARRKDYRFYQIETRDGVHGTQCKATDKPKSWLTVWNRLADFYTGERPVYYDEVRKEKQIGPYPRSVAGVETPFDFLLSLANRWYKSEKFRKIVARTYPGCAPLAAKLDGGVGAASPWQGPGAESPGAHLMATGMEEVEAYGRPIKEAPVGNTVSGA